MLSATRRNTKQFFLLLAFSLLTLATIAQEVPQIPVTNPVERNPGQMDPKAMNQRQLNTLLSDQNREGEDMNAKFNTTRLQTDSLAVDDIRKNAYSPLATYGANIFTRSSVTSITELSTPPLDYPIGVGDEIIVAMWGGAEWQGNFVVARDGSIFPKTLGKITVQGLTFEQMRSLVYSRFMSVVPPSTNVSITMGQPRTIQVNVIGNVLSPGPLTVSAFSNAFNVIGLAGGVNEFGDLRSIQIRRNGVTINELDVYKYLETGDFGNHMYLQNNDYVVVGLLKKKVLASGQFIRPMYYQLRENEGVEALLRFAGGLTPEALGSGMKIIRSENERQVQKNVNANAILELDGQDFPLVNGDVVVVNPIKSGIENKIELQGEVAYPGIYELRPGDRLFDLINRAGGVTPNTFMKRAYIFRGAGDSTSLKADKLEVDLSELADTIGINSVNNVPLYKNDVVQLFSNADFGDPQYVEIFGEVRKEGRVRKYGGMTLEDLLYLAGGLKPSAEYGRLEIASVVNVDSAKQGLTPTRTLVQNYAIKPDLTIDSNSRNIMLKPFDQVFVRRNPTYELQQNVELVGMMRYPGMYSKISKTERLSSFIHRAGGLTENANLSGAVLYRRKKDYLKERMDEIEKRNKILQSDKMIFDSLGNVNFEAMDSIKSLKERMLVDSAMASFNDPISIELYRALRNPGSKHDIVLTEKDLLFIPERDPFVSVEGQVQSPIKVSFDRSNANVPFYIDQAGGYGEKPWKKRIYVKYANGKSRRTKNLFFIHFYPKVEEGSRVIVPLRPGGFGAVVDTIQSTTLSMLPAFVTAIILKYVNF